MIVNLFKKWRFNLPEEQEKRAVAAREQLAREERLRNAADMDFLASIRLSLLGEKQARRSLKRAKEHQKDLDDAWDELIENTRLDGSTET